MKWTSVKDRLPKEGKDVLGHAYEFGVFLGFHDGKYWKEGIYGNDNYIAAVTHWMPLPEPPKEEADGQQS